MSHERERLTALVLGGDREAAEALWTLAWRSSAWDEAVLAVRVLEDLDRSASLGAAMWAAGAGEPLARFTGALGLRLDAQLMARIEALRIAANRGRTRGGLELATVLRVLLVARQGEEGWVLCDERTLGLNWPLICLAVRRHDGAITLGLHGQEAFEDPGWGVPADLALAPEERGRWSLDGETQRWLEAWADEASGTFRVLVPATAPSLPLRTPDRLRELVERLGALTPSSRAFAALIEGLELVHRLEPARADALALEARDALERWPDAVRWLAIQHASVSLQSAASLSLVRELDVWLSSRAALEALAAAPQAAGLRRLRISTSWHTAGEPRVAAVALEVARRLGVEHLHVNGARESAALLAAERPEALRRLSVDAPRRAIDEARMLDGLEALEVVVAGEQTAPVVALLGSERAASLRELTLWAPPPRSLRHLQETGPHLTALLRALGGHPQGLRSLECHFASLSNEDVAALCRAWPQLERLALGGSALDAEAIRAIVASPLAATLRSLRLHTTRDFRTRIALGHRIGDRGCSLLAAAPLARLERLDLSAPGPGPVTRYGAAALAAAPWLPRLRWLDLSHNPLGDAGVRALCESDRLGALEVLLLQGTEHGADAAHTLAATPSLRSLRCLALDLHIGAAGLSALLASPHLSQLETLSIAPLVPPDLHPGRARRADARRLVAPPRERWPARLRTLSLDGAPLEPLLPITDFVSRDS